MQCVTKNTNKTHDFTKLLRIVSLQQILLTNFQKFEEKAFMSNINLNLSVISNKEVTSREYKNKAL